MVMIKGKRMKLNQIKSLNFEPDHFPYTFHECFCEHRSEIMASLRADHSSVPSYNYIFEYP